MGNQDTTSNPVEVNALPLTPAITPADDGPGIHPRSDSPTASTLTSEPPSKRVKLETTSENPTSNVQATAGDTSAAVSQPASLEKRQETPNSLGAAPPLPASVPQSTAVVQSSVKKEDEKDLLPKKKEEAVAAVKSEADTSSPAVTPSPPCSDASGQSMGSSSTSLHDTAAPSTSTATASVPSATPTYASSDAAPQTPSNAASAPAAPASTTPDIAPLKSTTMGHLKTKYLGELEYMLREFRKLERQLLGAKGAAQIEESAGSRERREKLHSFILHLEDTVRQIEMGCRLESEGKSTIVNSAAVAAGGGAETTSTTTSQPAAATATADASDDAKKQMAEASALTNLTKEKEEEENVQKLEEHILANLLPVKVRLKKQLAAQQGASRNPAGMPAPRRGMLQPSAVNRGKGTFAAAAEQRQKQVDAARLAEQQQQENAVRHVSDPTQFGKPLVGGGSSLTQKLHGATLGSKNRTQGHGVGIADGTTEPTTSERKILYAGMVPGSTQHQSGVAAASGVHELMAEDPNILEQQEQTGSDGQDNSIAPAGETVVRLDLPLKPSTEMPRKVLSKALAPVPTPQAIAAAKAAVVKKESKIAENANLTEEERRKLRKKRRKKKRLRLVKRRERERQRQLVLHQQAQAAQGSSKVVGGRKKAVVGKGQGKKKGPRAVEYICALCSEAYSSTCEYNPWWALAQHECPKCRKTQVPRIDITSPANAIEYHPALLAHADDNGGAGGGGPANVNVMHISQPQAPSSVAFSNKPSAGVPKDPMFHSDSESDLSELSDGSLSDDSSDSDDSTADLQSMTPAEQAEHETFGYDYEGPAMSDYHASRLLVLMAHASTCPCRHKLTKHRDICRSTKFLMLHVRDCPGTTSSFDVCPFPWCRKVKHLLYHLVSCTDRDQCEICSPQNLSRSLEALVGLNGHRLKKHRERMITAAKAAIAGRPKGVPVMHQHAVLPMGHEKASSGAVPHRHVHRTSGATARFRPTVVQSSATVQQAAVTVHPQQVSSPPAISSTSQPRNVASQLPSQAKPVSSQAPIATRHPLPVGGQLTQPVASQPPLAAAPQPSAPSQSVLASTQQTAAVTQLPHPGQPSVRKPIVGTSQPPASSQQAPAAANLTAIPAQTLSNPTVTAMRQAPSAAVANPQATSTVGQQSSQTKTTSNQPATVTNQVPLVASQQPKPAPAPPPTVDSPSSSQIVEARSQPAVKAQSSASQEQAVETQLPPASQLSSQSQQVTNQPIAPTTSQAPSAETQLQPSVPSQPVTAAPDAPSTQPQQPVASQPASTATNVLPTLPQQPVASQPVAVAASAPPTQEQPPVASQPATVTASAPPTQQQPHVAGQPATVAASAPSTQQQPVISQPATVVSNALPTQERPPVVSLPSTATASAAPSGGGLPVQTPHVPSQPLTSKQPESATVEQQASVSHPHVVASQQPRIAASGQASASEQGSSICTANPTNGGPQGVETGNLVASIPAVTDGMNAQIGDAGVEKTENQTLSQPLSSASPTDPASTIVAPAASVAVQVSTASSEESSEIPPQVATSATPGPVNADTESVAEKATVEACASTNPTEEVKPVEKPKAWAKTDDTESTAVAHEPTSSEKSNVVTSTSNADKTQGAQQTPRAEVNALAVVCAGSI